MLMMAGAAQAEFLVIAHRGASGERPEHTLAAYERAIDQGADYIEPDLVATKDLVLVARHENELSGTTDVASREEFADRRRTKEVDGQRVAGWFAEDFTLAELRTLRAKERIPSLRPANARFDGLYPVPTFDEIVALVRAKEAETGRRIGLYPELKHPTFLLQNAGIDMVDLMVAALRKHDLDDADDRVFVQVFEVEPLRRLDRLVETPLVQLVAAQGGPADAPAMRYADMIAPSGLAEIATYADAIGADLRVLLTESGASTGLTQAAKAAGLDVHAWTVRRENAFLPVPLRSAGGEGAPGDLAGLVALLEQAGVDGAFTDNVIETVRAVRAE
ncbi:glycerophosphodiester phosphodiesterase [Erythrobacter pelagi]|uniref:glycerophosphodiester phosphodiesterase n=1 Tax=Qipengyuania pelagi TaxID=994320 RepID=A0A844YB27_9SPHN|nr:glycerophosphodiester phosphodiesterase family protein [Qipengyuania pelagi]MXO55081.1 glycerophosphodiester phosphodiesterase [Qipengyuania pelagi]